MDAPSNLSRYSAVLTPNEIVRWMTHGLLKRASWGSEVGQQVALENLGLTPESVLSGYLLGYFPMPDDQGRLRWFSPEMRAVIPVTGFHVPKNLARLVRQNKFEIRVDTSFADTIRGCAERDNTWITAEVIAVYEELHHRGIAHSVEAWQDGELAGGLYGLAIGSYFVTESQFHRVRDAGKIAFIMLARLLEAGGYQLHDVQFQTEFLLQFGSVELPAREFHGQLLKAAVQPGKFELAAIAQ